MTNRTNPMTTDAMLKLAARCEQATGPDRELDMAICLALDTGRRVTGSGRWLGPDCFTGSLDVALLLIQDGMEWRAERRVGKGMSPAYASIWGPGARDIDHHDNARAKTVPLALCAAALKAKASQ
jgi:hypothetical protein